MVGQCAINGKLTMTDQHLIVFRRFTISIAIVVCGLLFCTGLVVASDCTDHRVFGKFPATGDLRKEVDNFKNEHPVEFAAARADFDLAVRSNRDLQGPKVPGQPVPHVVEDYRLVHIPSLDMLEDSIRIWQKTEGGEETVAFLRQHADALTMDYTPALRIVALDVLIDGWDDWDAWHSQRLVEYRKRHPDIYRWDALTVLAYYIHRQGDASMDGLLLRLLIDPTLPYETRQQLPGFATRGDPDMLDFVVACRVRGETAEVRDACAVWTQRVSETLSNEQRQVFWWAYLDSQERTLRNVAVIEIGRSRLRSREESLARHPDQRIVARLQNIANTDPDEQIRAAALNGVKAYTDDSPPRGLIDYSKQNK